MKIIKSVTSFTGRDLIGVQNLMKKHQALQAELAGHEPRINNVSQLGGEMVNDGHFAAEEIQGRLGELEDRWKTLKVQMSPVTRRPALCICKNKGADQLCGNHAADQRLCLHCIDRTIPLRP